jgi:hypothetical protein
MRRILPILLPTLLAIVTAALMLLHAARAQTVGAPSAGMGVPAMGATSPLGLPGATSTPATSGIPLGSTEINPGGLSPMPLTACPTLPSGTFDGGGLTGCTATVLQPSAGSSAPPLPASGGDPALSGANIPLSATETTNLGLSPPITGPGTIPGAATSSTTMAAPTATSGLTAPMMAPGLALPSARPCIGGAGAAFATTLSAGVSGGC